MLRCSPPNPLIVESLTRPPPMHAAIILLVFLFTYAGMAAGRLPWLQVGTRRKRVKEPDDASDIRN